MSGVQNLFDELSAPTGPVPQRTTRGDIWRVGPHLLLVDSTTVTAAAEFLNQYRTGDHVMMVTDPPYSSGGFQPATKGSSVGKTNETRPILGDLLSTRGFQVRMRETICAVRADSAYIFTDWRMWHHLLDTIEGMCGLRARSMIVWNKGSAGMGRGWRAQHELIMFADTETPLWDKHWPALGNVVTLGRTVNKWHPTEKPLELMSRLVVNSPFAEMVVDPFVGSGTTMLAAAMHSLPSLGIEINPDYVNIALERLHRLTGHTPEQVAGVTG